MPTEDAEKTREVRTPRLLGMGFIGVWNITDDGNVPPRAIIRGTEARIGGFGGVAFNAERGEVYGVGRQQLRRVPRAAVLPEGRGHIERTAVTPDRTWTGLKGPSLPHFQRRQDRLDAGA